MNPIAAQLMLALAPVALRAAGPLLNRAGHTVLDVYSHNGRAVGNLINALADRVRAGHLHANAKEGGSTPTDRPPPVKTGPNTVIPLPPPRP